MSGQPNQGILSLRWQSPQIDKRLESFVQARLMTENRLEPARYAAQDNERRLLQTAVIKAIRWRRKGAATRGNAYFLGALNGIAKDSENWVGKELGKKRDRTLLRSLKTTLKILLHPTQTTK
jgi:hypothetical protein